MTPALIVKQADSPEDPMPGWNVLAVGWVGIFINQFGWYANSFWLVGLICGFLKFYKLGSIAASVGLLVSVFSIVMLFSQDIPANEGNVGPPFKLIGLGIGCWLWLVAQLLVLGANIGNTKGGDASRSENEKSEKA